MPITLGNTSITGITGNQGIGTDSPLALLHIQGNTTGAVQAFIKNSNGGTSSSADLVFGNWSGSIPSGSGNPGPQAKIAAINTLNSNAATDLVFSTYNGSLSAERMRIDSAGRVRMPFQPVFSARGPGSGTNPGSDQRLPFTVVNVNKGSHYNTATSTFTAPIAGTYFFYFQALSDSSSARVIASIQLNGVQHVEASATALHYNSVQAQAIIALAAGDAVRIQTAGGSDGARFYFASSNQNHFMGYLIG